MKNPEYQYPIKIVWGEGANSIEYWNQICVYAVEQFGVPGKRYITEVSADYMIWSFKSEQDALIFKLRFSEVAI